MAWWDTLLKVGGFAAAPFTGGASLLPALATGAAGAGAGFALNKAFGGGGDKKDEEHPENALNQMLMESAQRSRGEGQALSSLGSESLAPVTQFFRDILGSDPAAIMDATRQERGRVIDQYDTARRAISQFGPRGGGTTSALAESRFAEGSDLADLVSSARNQAVTNAASLGVNLTGLGLSANQLASADLNTVINSILSREQLDVNRRGQNLGALTGLGEAAGSLLGLFLTRPGGIWGPAKAGTA